MGNYVLGLDIGINSIGWAQLKLAEGAPTGLLDTGVRIFTAGVEVKSEDDFKKGRDEARNVARRSARQRRIHLMRQSRRMARVIIALQKSGLLPTANVGSPESRHAFFLSLDKETLPGIPNGTGGPYYRLRAMSLDQKLSPHQIGRALCHLAQRRGFQSNRKSAPQKGERPGEVASSISGLQQKIAASGARTLGEYLSKLDVSQERIRDRWTHRDMFREEFEKIWSAQAVHYPDLMTDTHKKDVHRAIFHQRSLRSMSGKIGECSLEKGRKRAPMAILTAQRFRLLQKANDLKIIFKTSGEQRPPTPEERMKMLTALENEGDQTFPKLKKLLGLNRGEATFNFEVSGGDENEKGIPGNRTAKKLREVFGDSWDGLPAQDKNQIVEDWLTIEDDKALERRGTTRWGLPPEKARAFAELKLEPKYCALSRKALGKILPEMEKDVPFATAKKTIWPEKNRTNPFPLLPSLDKAEEEGWMPVLRNPAVRRALCELRKVVNALLRRDGKPTVVRVELARDLKRSREDRKGAWKRNETNRKARERAAEAVLKEAGIEHPSRPDVDKWLLREECGGICPYTGQPISARALFSGEFDVEHIVPFSRSLDDSFLNKTLCHAEENRSRKKNHTPWEAYGKTPQWDDILARVNGFRGDATETKRRRFIMKDINLESFTSRQLNDTRYASRLAVQYLGLLFGADARGVAGGKPVVQGGRGEITEYVRGELSLNGILNDGGEKTRADHRHHAVDAVAIALTDAGMVRRLSEAASHADQERRRRFGHLSPPWPTLLEDVRIKISAVIPSHQPSRKVNGPLHEETTYSKLHAEADGHEYVHVRKPIEGLSSREVEAIVDPAVRAQVKTALGEKAPRETFKDPAAHPSLPTRGGRSVPIHSVRIQIHETTTSIGPSANQRRVITGSNHHVEILETRGKRGEPKWEGRIVTRLDALRRLHRGEPVVKRDHGEGKEFKFSLCGGDIIQLEEEEKKTLHIIRSIGYVKQGASEYANLAFVPLTDARMKKKILAAKEWTTSFVNRLRALKAKKITVSPIGEIRDAND
jgi:CRISPR-associated endonuclease Csn1